MTNRVGHFHVITSAPERGRFTHIDIARLAIEGGADTIQFRDKSMHPPVLIETARAVLAVCRLHDVPLIINDRVDVAMAVGADGVHLGRDDLPIAAARRVVGPGMLIGGTASTTEQARQAESDGADYIGFGHIYGTTSKVKTGPPRGPDALGEACEAVRIPVIAIGGITVENIAPVLSAGASGIAVIAAVCHAEDPAAAARQLAGIVATHRRQ